jgi:hypothetical protein
VKGQQFRPERVGINRAVAKVEEVAVQETLLLKGKSANATLTCQRGRVIRAPKEALRPSFDPEFAEYTLAFIYRRSAAAPTSDNHPTVNRAAVSGWLIRIGGELLNDRPAPTGRPVR